MRYHSARVVLGACLIAAASAAQAPASILASHSAADSAAGERGPFAPRGARGVDRPEADPPGGERFATPRPGFAYQQPQDEPYSLRHLFLSHHGEFMERRERYTPDIELRARLYPNQRINHEPGSFDELHYDLDAKVPVLVSPDGYLTVGAYYGGRRYVTSPAFGSAGNAAGIGDEMLTSTGVTVGFGVFLSDNVLFEAETHPGIWSDMDDTLHHEDFDFPSEALFTIRTVPNFFFKVGARYNQVYEEAPWLPYLGFGWEVMEGLRIDVLAPESAEVSWWPDAGFGLMFGTQVTGAEYRVHTSEAIGPGGQSGDTQVQEVVAYLGLLSRLNDYTSFALRAGIVVAGDYDFTTGQAGFDPAEGALDQGVYAEASFGIRF